MGRSQTLSIIRPSERSYVIQSHGHTRKVHVPEDEGEHRECQGLPSQLWPPHIRRDIDGVLKNTDGVPEDCSSEDEATMHIFNSEEWQQARRVAEARAPTISAPILPPVKKLQSLSQPKAAAKKQSKKQPAKKGSSRVVGGRRMAVRNLGCVGDGDDDQPSTSAAQPSADAKKAEAPNKWEQVKAQFRHQAQSNAAAAAHPVMCRAAEPPPQLGVWDWSLLDNVEPQSLLTFAPTTTSFPQDLLPRLAPCINRILDAMRAGVSSAWKLFLLLPRILFQRRRGGKRARAGLLSALNDLAAGNWSALVTRALIDSAGSAGGRQQQQQQQAPADERSKMKRALRRVIQLAKLGAMSKALRALVDLRSPVPVTQQVFEKLSAKHPKHASVGEPPARPTPQHELKPLKDSSVIPILRKSPKGSAQDIFGLRYEHLWVFALAGADSQLDLLSQALCSVDSPVPQDLRPFFFGAKLIALPKDNGDIRPIAAGCCLRRLVARALAEEFRGVFASYLAPLQVGVGIPGGTEHPLYLLRVLRACDPDALSIVEFDCVNAFNAVDRWAFLRTFDADFPAVYPWLYSCYGSPSLLCLQTDDGKLAFIESGQGTQQGDPLGPVAFAVALHKILKEVSEACPGVATTAYVDDVFLAGPRQLLPQAVDLLVKAYASIQLQPNFKKTFSAGAAPVDGLQFIATGAKCLGSTLWPSQPPSLEELDPEFIILCERIPLIADTQVALLLLRYAVDCHASYACRTLLPCYSRPAMQEMERRARHLLDAVTGLPVVDSDLLWLQTTQPMSRGGLGLLNPLDVVDPGFAAAWHGFAVGPFSKSQVVVDALQTPNFCTSQLGMATEQAVELVSTLTEEELERSSRRIQRALCWKQRAQEFGAFKAQAGRHISALIAERSDPRASDWLRAIPTLNALSIPAAPFRAALALRYGMTPSGGLDCTCRCGVALGHLDAAHLLICPHGATTIHRHDALVALLARLAREVGAHVQEEPIVGVDADSRVDLVIDLPAAGAAPCAVDLAVVTSATPSRTATESNAVAETQRQKARKHGSDCERLQLAFRPLIIDSCGRWDSHMDKTVLELVSAAAAAETPDGDAADATFDAPNWAARDRLTYWQQALSVCLHRRNGLGALRLLSRVKMLPSRPRKAVY